jgi:hypothetical protein
MLSKADSSVVVLIQSKSGLTSGQIARLFDVPERSVRLWASGGNMDSHNYKAASRLLSKVQSLAGQTPEARRKEILMPGKFGVSLFDQWRKYFQDKSLVVNPSKGGNNVE